MLGLRNTLGNRVDSKLPTAQEILSAPVRTFYMMTYKRELEFCLNGHLHSSESDSGSVSGRVLELQRLLPVCKLLLEQQSLWGSRDSRDLNMQPRLG